VSFKAPGFSFLSSLLAFDCRATSFFQQLSSSYRSKIVFFGFSVLGALLIRGTEGRIVAPFHFGTDVFLVFPYQRYPFHPFGFSSLHSSPVGATVGLISFLFSPGFLWVGRPQPSVYPLFLLRTSSPLPKDFLFSPSTTHLSHAEPTDFFAGCSLHPWRSKYAPPTLPLPSFPNNLLFQNG